MISGVKNAMISITVTGGKGGTGKSFVATSLAILLSKSIDGLVLADTDLEGPNDHVILGIEELENREPITLFLPMIDTTKCTRCGVCVKICDTGALFMGGRTYPIVFPRLCSGCKACYYSCPYGAIREAGHVLGYTYVTPVCFSGRCFKLVTGMLIEGEEHTPPGVYRTLQRALELKPELLIVDTGAGTGNAVSMGFRDSDLVIVVTEPTPLGAHDLDSILEVTDAMDKQVWLVVNRYGIGDISILETVLHRHRVEKIFHIPYDKAVVEAYAYSKPLIIHYPGSPASRALIKISDELMGWIKH